jgi:hypothetical protein
MDEPFVLLDDSRPEAFSRRHARSVHQLVLEGGLVKIPNVRGDYNFGFGLDENVFGCLAETFALALPSQKSISPTLGDVDMGNFRAMRQLFQCAGMTAGDFKSADRYVPQEQLAHIVQSRWRMRHE